MASGSKDFKGSKRGKARVGRWPSWFDRLTNEGFTGHVMLQDKATRHDDDQSPDGDSAGRSTIMIRAKVERGQGEQRTARHSGAAPTDPDEDRPAETTAPERSGEAAPVAADGQCPVQRSNLPSQNLRCSKTAL